MSSREKNDEKRRLKPMSLTLSRQPSIPQWHTNKSLALNNFTQQDQVPDTNKNKTNAVKQCMSENELLTHDATQMRKHIAVKYQCRQRRHTLNCQLSICVFQMCNVVTSWLNQTWRPKTSMYHPQWNGRQLDRAFYPFAYRGMRHCVIPNGMASNKRPKLVCQFTWWQEEVLWAPEEKDSLREIARLSRNYEIRLRNSEIIEKGL